MTREIKYRQENNGVWHYWGYVKDRPEEFISPISLLNAGKSYQYTGLHDKNGKEIYKGDIFDMGVIGFDRGCFNGFYTESRSDDKGWDYSDSWEDGMYHYVLQNEIIGNIYENPDLLNKE